MMRQMLVVIRSKHGVGQADHCVCPGRNDVAASVGLEHGVGCGHDCGVSRDARGAQDVWPDQPHLVLDEVTGEDRVGYSDLGLPRHREDASAEAKVAIMLELREGKRGV